jgi:hypothetical protein
MRCGRRLRRLVDYGVLERGEKIGHLPTYRLHPDVGYYGPLRRRYWDQRQQAARQRLEDLAGRLEQGEELDISALVEQARGAAVQQYRR